MKSFIAVALLAVGTDALVARGGSCCFHLTASGGESGVVRQLYDGQNRIGDNSLPEGTYCLNNGGLTDGKGRGCILTAPTTQFQCDVGANPTGGFAVGCHGSLTHNGDSTFWACPTGDNGGYNIYTTPAPNQPKCVQIQLNADKCHKKCSAPKPKQCPTNLGGGYQFPHLIVPINSAQPDHAYGTSYNGEVTKTISTIFNFDIPSSYAGKTCSFIFRLPEKNKLPTSSYTLSGSGGFSFAELNGPASQSTDYANAPGVKQNYGVTNVTPGHAYNIATFPCPAGQTIAFWIHSAGSYIDYFQDYNAPAIGAYVTVC